MPDITGLQTVLLNRCATQNLMKFNLVKFRLDQTSHGSIRAFGDGGHVTFSLSASNRIIPQEDLLITLTNSGDAGTGRSHYSREFIE